MSHRWLSFKYDMRGHSVGIFADAGCMLALLFLLERLHFHQRKYLDGFDEEWDESGAILRLNAEHRLHGCHSLTITSGMISSGIYECAKQMEDDGFQVSRDGIAQSLCERTLAGEKMFLCGDSAVDKKTGRYMKVIARTCDVVRCCYLDAGEEKVDSFRVDSLA